MSGFTKLRTHLTRENISFGFGLIGMVVVSYVVGSFIHTHLTRSQEEYITTSHTKEAFLSAEHYYHRDSHPLTFIAYLDLDCPHCQKFWRAYTAFADTEKPESTLIVRHFPLTDWHPSAFEKAVMLECIAVESGDAAFFRFLNDYFAKESITMSTSSMYTLSESYVPNPQTYRACVSSEDAKNRVRDHMKQGLYSGVFSTPTLVVLRNDVFLAKYDLLTDTTGMRIVEEYLKLHE